ncbi:head-tail connector protein [Variovorax sp. RT4R15]|uniref:head-tail connector protein n=1 Tax=Variovorax sp. RT4R15 TaxID=3443737 RepID=UPI003F45B846
MSTITLAQVKEALRVTDTNSDALLTRLLASAIQECLRFTNRTELPTLPLDYPDESSSEDIESSEDPVAADACQGVMVMIHADFDASPADRPRFRAAAEDLWQPYRRLMGV